MFGEPAINAENDEKEVILWPPHGLPFCLTMINDGIFTCAKETALFQNNDRLLQYLGSIQ